MRANEQHLEFPQFHRRVYLSDGTPASLIDFSGYEVDDQRVAVVRSNEIKLRLKPSPLLNKSRQDARADVRKYSRKARLTA